MSNCARITVTPDGPWRLYQHIALPGWTMLGTVQRGTDIGALGRSAVGVYAQLNAGAVRSLDQRKVQAALDAAAA
jgi:hypothetical protein